MTKIYKEKFSYLYVYGCIVCVYIIEESHTKKKTFWIYTVYLCIFFNKNLY